MKLYYFRARIHLAISVEIKLHYLMGARTPIGASEFFCLGFPIKYKRGTKCSIFRKVRFLLSGSPKHLRHHDQSFASLCYIVYSHDLQLVSRQPLAGAGHCAMEVGSIKSLYAIVYLSPSNTLNIGAGLGLTPK